MEKLKKLKDKKYIMPAIVVIIVVLLVALPFIIDSSRPGGGTEASILSGTVGRSSISSTISGTGTLMDEEAFEIELPEGVRLKAYLVSNGETVKAGDPLAEVDKVSVMETISTVQENLEYLEEQMTEVSTQYGESYISSSVSGTVKEIYAQPGDNVRDVMLSHGALALVSLDGLMAVDISSQEALRAGDEVCVILPDKSRVSGSVKSAVNGVLSITFPDNGYELGQTVEAETVDGKSLGSGESYLNRGWKATAFTGTVSYVYIYEDSSVYSGSTLFYLSDTDYSADYELLAAKHRAYEELMSELFQMYQDGVINAPADGIISGIDKDTVELLSGTKSPGFASLLSVSPVKSGSALKVSLLSADDGGADTAPSAAPEPASAPEASPTPEPAATQAPAPSTEPIPTPTVEPTPTPSPTASPETSPEVTAEPVPSTSPDTARYTNYLGIVTGSGSAKLNPSPVAVDDYSQYRSSSAEGMTQEISFSTDSVYIYSDSAWTKYACSAGDILLFVYDENGILAGALWVGQAENGSSEGVPGGTQMGGAGMSGGVSAQEEEYEMFSLEGTVIMSVTPMEKMSVSFTVDELDILSLSRGQSAQLTVDALPGQSFEGTVTGINSSGGNRKYTVELSLDRVERMIAGMNASVVITVDTKENVLSVPAEAQATIGGRSYLYTGYDKSSGTLTDPVEIVTGSSDGVNVEILSGLDEGASYWYSYYDTPPFEFPF